MPDRIDDPIDGNRPMGLECEQGEDRPPPTTGNLHPPAVDLETDRTEETHQPSRIDHGRRGYWQRAECKRSERLHRQSGDCHEAAAKEQR